MSFENTHMVADLIASSKLWIGDGYRAKNSELDSAGIPFARAGDINDGFHFTSGDCLPEEDAWKAGNKLSEAGDVVFTSKGTVGRFGFVTEGIQRFVYSPQLCFWRSLDCEAIYPRFLFYWIQGKEFYRQYKSVSQKTDMAEYVSLSDQRSMEITLPELSSQKAIAHILGTLDDKIELNRKTNETLEAMAKALFKSWFVDFDPVRAKAEGCPTGLPAEISDLFPDSFEDSELGEIPSGWEVIELGMVSTFLNGYAFKSSDWQEHGVPVVKIGSVKPGFVDIDNVSFVSDEIAVSKDRYRLSPGDILIGMTGYVGEVGLVPISESPPLLNQRVGKVAPMSDAIVSRSFLYNWMRTSTFKDSVEVLSHGSAQANVSSDSIQSIPHAIPSSNIESAFASICEPILDRLLEGHREQKLLANTRDALLPKLISGEIRIPDAEKILQEVGI